MLQDIRIRQRDYLIKMTQILTQELELEPLLWQVIQMAVDLVGGESGFVALYNETNGWQIQTQLNLSDPELKYIETYLSVATRRRYMDRCILLYDRIWDRTIDNSKVLAATGLEQSGLMRLYDGLKKEIARCPKDYQWRVNAAMDEYLATH